MEREKGPAEEAGLLSRDDGERALGEGEGVALGPRAHPVPRLLGRQRQGQGLRRRPRADGVRGEGAGGLEKTRRGAASSPKRRREGVRLDAQCAAEHVGDVEREVDAVLSPGV